MLWVFKTPLPPKLNHEKCISETWFGTHVRRWCRKISLASPIKPGQRGLAAPQKKLNPAICPLKVLSTPQKQNSRCGTALFARIWNVISAHRLWNWWWHSRVFLTPAIRGLPIFYRLLWNISRRLLRTDSEGHHRINSVFIQSAE